jgi:hypothetical protein
MRPWGISAGVGLGAMGFVTAPPGSNRASRVFRHPLLSTCGDSPPSIGTRKRVDEERSTA